jgi:hypothetical protein
MYIVIFNLGYRDPIIMTNSNGFVREFGDNQSAKAEAETWIDGKDFRKFTVYEEQEVTKRTKH